MKLRRLIHSLNGGELSRRMEGRSDLDGIYDRAVAQMLNYVPTVEGPAMKRPGFRYIAAAAASAAWASRFVFNSTQAYVLEWSDGIVRFYTNGGRIETAPGVPFELAVPYAAAEARYLSIRQSFDRLYIAHPEHPPAMITRTGAESFTYEVIPLKNGPYKDWNVDKAQNVTWGTGSGEVDSIATIGSEVDLFAADMVGAPFIFEVKDFSTVKAWEPQIKTRVADATSSIVAGAFRRSNGKVYQCTSLGGSKYTGTIEPTHTEGSEWDGSAETPIGSDDGDHMGVQWLYIHDRFGAGTITEYVSATSVKIKVTRRLPDITKTVETYKWAFGAFSEAEGFPQLVDRWGQRLIFWKGVDIAGSVVGDYFDFAPIDKSGIFAPDQGFRRRLDTADPPIWSQADKEYLLGGTASGELVVGQINRSAGLSSDNLRGDPQTSYGSANVFPLAIGASLLFVQRGGRKIREVTFDGATERFVGPNLNIYARHVTRSGILWLSHQAEPEEIVWGGRGDGTLIAHPHNPEQQIKGFARAELAQGTQLSGVSIPSEDGSSDELWILAELDGQRAMLQLAPWWDEDAGTDMVDAFYVDWGVSYDGTALDELGDPLGPKGTFTEGLSHLEGKIVRILADGVQIDGKVVAGGAIALDVPATKVHIGLGYAAQIRLLRPEVRGAPSIQGLRSAVKRLLARLIDSAAPIFIGNTGERDRLRDRSPTTPMGSPEPLYSGDTGNKGVSGRSELDPGGEIVSDDAYPSMISLLVPTYEVEEAKA